MRPDLLPSRRAVLTGGVAALALSACGSESLPSILGGNGSTAAAPSGPPLATAEADAWIAAAGSTFTAGGHPMRLVGVERVGAAGGRSVLQVLDQCMDAAQAGDIDFGVGGHALAIAGLGQDQAAIVHHLGTAVG